MKTTPAQIFLNYCQLNGHPHTAEAVRKIVEAERAVEVCRAYDSRPYEWIDEDRLGKRQPEAATPWKTASDAMWSNPAIAAVLGQDEAGEATQSVDPRWEYFEKHPALTIPTQPNAPVSVDLFAQSTTSPTPAQQTQPNARESAFGDESWRGYDLSNWEWPLLSRGVLKEIT